MGLVPHDLSISRQVSANVLQGTSGHMFFKIQLHGCSRQPSWLWIKVLSWKMEPSWLFIRLKFLMIHRSDWSVQNISWWKIQAGISSNEWLFHPGPWWWSSGQHSCLLLQRSELESCLLIKFYVRKVKNKWKRGRGWPNLKKWLFHQLQKYYPSR